MEAEKKERIWLIEARKKKGMTQEQLAKIIGVTCNCITQYEKNQRFPKPEILVKICKILDVEISSFYEE